MLNPIFDVSNLDEIILYIINSFEVEVEAVYVQSVSDMHL